MPHTAPAAGCAGKLCASLTYWAVAAYLRRSRKFNLAVIIGRDNPDLKGLPAVGGGHLRVSKSFHAGCRWK